MKDTGQSTVVLEKRWNDNPNGLVFARLANSLLEHGDSARAADLCVAGLKRYPNYTSARLVLARCLMEQGRYDQALTELRRAARLDRRSPRTLRLIADVLARSNDNETAGSIYAYLLHNDPDNADLEYAAASVPGQPPDDIIDVVTGPTVQAATAAPAPAPVAEPRQEEQTQEEVQDLDALTRVLESDDDEVDLEEITGSHKIPSAPVVSAPDTVEPSPDMDQFIESAETIALTPDSEEEGVSSDDITGQDVSYRIDALFGEEQAAQGPAQKAPPNRPSDPLTELFASGQLDDSSRIDTGRFAMEEVVNEDLETADEDTLSDAEAFGATMAFDQSMLSGDDTAEAIDEHAGAADEFEVEEEPEEEEESDEPLSGVDVTSRLDEMFSFGDDSEIDLSETIQPRPPAEETPPTDQTIEYVEEPLSGSNSSIDTAVTDSALFPSESETKIGEQTAFMGDQTAEFVTDEPGEQTAELQSPGESEPEAVLEMPDDDEGSDIFAGLSSGDEDKPGEAESDTLASTDFSLDDDLLKPADETAELSLDQEMSFGASEEGESLGDMLTMPLEESTEESTDDQATGFIVTEEEPTAEAPEPPPETPTPDAQIESAATAEIELPPPEAQTADADASAETPTPDVHVDSAPTAEIEIPTADDVASEVTSLFGSAGGNDDLFGETQIPTTEEPKDKQERAEEAQTLEFARDELEDLVALGGGAPAEVTEVEDEEDQEEGKIGDTTTMAALVTDEAGDIDIKSISADDTSAIPVSEITEQAPPPEEQPEPQPATSPGDIFDEQVADIGQPPAAPTGEQYGEISLEEEPAVQEAQTEGVETPIANAETGELTEDLLAAKTDTYEQVKPQTPAQNENPFEQYADEISQAQTLLFRRKDLERYTGESDEAAQEERDELTDQISKAHTVEFGRQELAEMAARAQEEADTLSETSLTSGETLSTGDVFDDSSDTVEQQPPEDAETVPPEQPLVAGSGDPFVDDTMATVPTDTVAIREDTIAEEPPAAPAIPPADPFLFDAELAGEAEIPEVPEEPEVSGKAEAEPEPFEDTVSEMPVATPEDDTVAEEPVDETELPELALPEDSRDTVAELPSASPAEDTVVEEPSEAGDDDIPVIDDADQTVVDIPTDVVDDAGDADQTVVEVSTDDVSDDTVLFSTPDTGTGDTVEETPIEVTVIEEDADQTVVEVNTDDVTGETGLFVTPDADAVDTVAEAPVETSETEDDADQTVVDVPDLDDEDIADTVVDNVSTLDVDSAPELPETVVMDPADTLVDSELVWEEDAPADIEIIVDGSTATVRDGGLADTVSSDADEILSDAELEKTDEIDRDKMRELAGRSAPAEAEEEQAPEELPEQVEDEESIPEPEPEPETADAAASTESDAEIQSQLAAIPDHVLTPTLADIYYHQGQPRLAVEIYRRLLTIDPENERIADRLAEIESELGGAEAPTPAQPAAPKPPARQRAARSSTRSTTRREPSASGTDTDTSDTDEDKPTKKRARKSRKRAPLSGVKIKKEVRDRHRRKSPRRRSK